MFGAGLPRSTRTVGKHCLVAILAVFGLLGTIEQHASAQTHNSIFLDIPIVTPFGGGFNWAYDARLHGGALATGNSRKIVAGDFFTIYDFQGLVPAIHSEPVGWVFSFQPLGINPPGVTPVLGDSAAVFNVTWTYVGLATIGPTTGDLPLGTFTANSIFGLGSTIVDYAGQDTTNFPGSALDNTKNGNREFTLGPQAVVPVSGAHTVLIGMAGAALCWWKKRPRLIA